MVGLRPPSLCFRQSIGDCIRAAFQETGVQLWIISQSAIISATTIAQIERDWSDYGLLARPQFRAQLRMQLRAQP